jgi:hypothetical protein
MASRDPAALRTALWLMLHLLLAQHVGRWCGTPTALLQALTACWWGRAIPPPRSAAWLMRALKRATRDTTSVAPDLPCSVASWRSARRRVVALSLRPTGVELCRPARPSSQPGASSSAPPPRGPRRPAYHPRRAVPPGARRLRAAPLQLGAAPPPGVRRPPHGPAAPAPSARRPRLPALRPRRAGTPVGRALRPPQPLQLPRHRPGGAAVPR